MLAKVIFLLTRRWSMLLIVLCWAGWLVWLWQPERQVRLHQENFLKAISNKNWDKAGRFVSANFVDRWGHDKESVVREGKEITFHFLTLNIESLDENVSATGPSGTVTAKLRIEGMGNPVAEMAKDAVAALRTPFEFDWKRTGPAPWDWELTRVDNPELSIPASREW